MLVRPLLQTPVLCPLFISLCLRSAVFQQAGCQQENRSEHRSDNAFALHSQMLQHSSPRATQEVLEGKDGWTTPLAIDVRDEMWPVQRSFRRLSLSEVALALRVTQVASAGQTINPRKSLIIKVSCSKCLYHHP